MGFSPHDVTMRMERCPPTIVCWVVEQMARALHGDKYWRSTLSSAAVLDKDPMITARFTVMTRRIKNNERGLIDWGQGTGHPDGFNFFNITVKPVQNGLARSRGKVAVRSSWPVWATAPVIVYPELKTSSSHSTTIMRKQKSVLCSRTSSITW